MSSAPPDFPRAAGWSAFRGRRVSLRARDGSYAARRAGTEAREADQAVAALEKLLAPPAEGQAIPLVLLIVPLFVVSFFGLQSRLQKASGEQQKRMGETNASIQETLAAQAAIKAFGLEDRTLEAYRVRLGAQIAAGLRLVLIGALANLSVTLAIALAQVVVLGVGGYLVVMSDSGTAGTLLFCRVWT